MTVAIKKLRQEIRGRREHGFDYCKVPLISGEA